MNIPFDNRIDFTAIDQEQKPRAVDLASGVFLRERLVSYLGITQQELSNFLDPFFDEIAIPYGNSLLTYFEGEAIGFVVSEPFPSPPAPPKLEEGVSDRLGMIFSLMERLDHLLLEESPLAPGDEHRGLHFHGLGDFAEPFEAALNHPEGSRVNHLLMGGVLEEHAGFGYATVLEGLRRSFVSGKDFSVAETTNPQSTAISLRFGCQVVARAAYAEFELGEEKPFSRIAPWQDWNPDINPTGDREKLFPSGCRLVVLDLLEMAKQQGWSR